MRIIDDTTLLVDFLEEELEADMKSDFERVIHQDPTVRRELGDLQVTRRALKKSGQVTIPQSSEYFEGLHRKIMAQVAESRIEIPSARRSPLRWKQFAAAAALALIAGSAFFYVSSRPQTTGMPVVSAPAITEADPDHMLLETSAQNPTLVAETIFSSDGNSDLILDATALKLNEMSDNEASSYLNDLLE